jgi:hypothetical protein
VLCDAATAPLPAIFSVVEIPDELVIEIGAPLLERDAVTGAVDAAAPGDGTTGC